MRLNLIAFGLFVAVASSAQAQTMDFSKITCSQFALSKVGNPRTIAAWVSGYYNARQNNTVIDLQNMEANLDKVQFFCQDQKNDKVPLMKAVEQLLGKGK